MSEQISITGIHLVHEGGEDDPKADAVVLVEIDGKWHEVIRENIHGNFSHIIETGGIRKAQIRDKLGNNEFLIYVNGLGLDPFKTSEMIVPRWKGDDDDKPYFIWYEHEGEKIRCSFLFTSGERYDEGAVAVMADLSKHSDDVDYFPFYLGWFSEYMVQCAEAIMVDPTVKDGKLSYAMIITDPLKTFVDVFTGLRLRLKIREDDRAAGETNT